MERPAPTPKAVRSNRIGRTKAENPNAVPYGNGVRIFVLFRDNARQKGRRPPSLLSFSCLLLDRIDAFPFALRVTFLQKRAAGGIWLAPAWPGEIPVRARAG